MIPGCKGIGVATRNYCYDPNLSRFAEVSQQAKEDARKETEKALEEQAKRNSDNSNIRGRHPTARKYGRDNDSNDKSGRNKRKDKMHD